MGLTGLEPRLLVLVTCTTAVVALFSKELRARMTCACVLLRLPEHGFNHWLYQALDATAPFMCRWGELHVCSVGEVVGPPYSLESVAPGSGAITGATRATVRSTSVAFAKRVLHAQHVDLVLAGNLR